MLEIRAALDFQELAAKTFFGFPLQSCVDGSVDAIAITDCAFQADQGNDLLSNQIVGVGLGMERTPVFYLEIFYNGLVI